MTCLGGLLSAQAHVTCMAGEAKQRWLKPSETITDFASKVVASVYVVTGALYASIHLMP